MAISRDLKIIIKQDKAKFEEPLYVYQNDRNIDIYIAISDYKYRFNEAKNLIRGLENAYAAISVKKPSGEEFKIEKSVVINEKIKFTITQEMTDDLNEIGVYNLQIHVFDEEGGRITIPPTEFEVKELMSNIAEEIFEGEVGKAVVGESKVEEEEELIILEVFADGIYIKNNWATGDKITASKLNKMEEGICENSIKIENIQLIPGPQGAPGRDGANGVDGERGQQGERGLTGAIGPQGEPGRDGANGINGERGQQGEKGLTGATGPQGVPGRDGANGVDGERGQQGEKGLTGATGPQGAPGRDGANGVDGERGQQGEKGLTGATGPQGAPGKDGAINPNADRVCGYALWNGTQLEYDSITNKDIKTIYFINV